jgi:hypothetical protein
MRAGPSRQRDLFEEDQPAAEVPTSVRVTLTRRGVRGVKLVISATSASARPRLAGAIAADLDAGRLPDPGGGLVLGECREEVRSGPALLLGQGRKLGKSETSMVNPRDITCASRMHVVVPWFVFGESRRAVRLPR